MTTPEDTCENIILKPVTDKNGVVLLDGYINGKVIDENWIGSRPTLRAWELVLGLRGSNKGGKQ